MQYRLEIKDEARQQLRALPKEHRSAIGTTAERPHWRCEKADGPHEYRTT